MTHYGKKKRLRHGLLIVVKPPRNGMFSAKIVMKPPFSTKWGYPAHKALCSKRYRFATCAICIYSVE